MRCRRSARLTAVARTRTRTSPRPGSGVSISFICNTSGPPNCEITIAFMDSPSARFSHKLRSFPAEVTMKKLLILASLFAGVSIAEAKCYHYDSSPSDVYVCVGKGGRDDFADRNKGQDICSQKTGKKCGPVGSYSSSCH